MQSRHVASAAPRAAVFEARMWGCCMNTPHGETHTRARALTAQGGRVVDPHPRFAACRGQHITSTLRMLWRPFSDTTVHTAHAAESTEAQRRQQQLLLSHAADAHCRCVDTADAKRVSTRQARRSAYTHTHAQDTTCAYLDWQTDICQKGKHRKREGAVVDKAVQQADASHWCASLAAASGACNNQQCSQHHHHHHHLQPQAEPWCLAYEWTLSRW